MPPRRLSPQGKCTISGQPSLQLPASNHNVNWYFPALIWAVGLAPLAQALNPRIPLDLLTDFDRDTALAPTALLASRGMTVLTSGVLLLLAAQVYRQSGVTYRQGLIQSLALSGVFVAYAISSCFGYMPTFEPRAVGLPLLATLVYLGRPSDLAALARHAHRVSLVWVLGSLTALLVAPGWADVVAPGGAGSLLDRSIRLQGLATHPNHLGSVSSLAVVLAVWRRDTRWRPVWITLALASLVLSGSRTAIVALAVGGVVAGYLSIRRAGPHTVAVVVSFGLALTSVLIATVNSQSFDNQWTTGAATGNGRTTVWAISLEEWRRSPVVGYGPTLWSENYRVSRGLSGLDWAGQAHNQFIQALGANGVLGLAALLAFVASLLAAGWNTRGSDRGLVLVAVTMMAVTMMGENLLYLNSYPTSVIPTLVFMLVVASLNHSYDRAGRSDCTSTAGVMRSPRSSAAHSLRT
jgi:O-antigen ligase